MATAISDAKLDLELQELVNRPRVSELNASPISGILKGLWTSLTFYQWTPSVQPGIDAAIRALQARRDSYQHGNAIAQTKTAMMSDPDFFPFCLSPQYWPDAQRAHFRGLVGQTTYQPPSYWQSVGSDAAKLIGPVFIGAVAATFLPEELVGGAVALAATRIAGKAITESAMKFAAKTIMGSGLAVGGSALATSLSGPSSSDAARDIEMWRRYKLEARRRSML